MDSGYSTTSAGTASIDGLSSDKESFRLNLAEDAFQATRYTKIKVIFASRFTNPDHTKYETFLMLWQKVILLSDVVNVPLHPSVILFPRFFILITELYVDGLFKGMPPPANGDRDQFAF